MVYFKLAPLTVAFRPAGRIYHTDPVSTRMGDRLWTGKPFEYVISQLG